MLDENLKHNITIYLIYYELIYSQHCIVLKLFLVAIYSYVVRL